VRRQQLEIGVRQPQVTEQLAGLWKGEREVGRAHLGHPPGHPQALQAHRRVAASRDHEAHELAAVLEQPVELLGDLLRADGVEVVEDEHKWLVAPRERIQHARPVPRSLVEGRESGDRRRDGAPERPGPLRLGAEREAHDLAGMIANRQPLREQRRLARAGRGGDQRERVAGAAVDPLDQSRAADLASLWRCRRDASPFAISPARRGF
jgi:hypothetical protein